jgi:hypothetical protein
MPPSPIRRFLQSSALLLPCATLVGALLACKQKSEDKTAPTASASAAAAQQVCPPTFASLVASAKESTCQCSAVPAAGRVWGTDIYTADSSICRAAVHAGVITMAGGQVTVRGAAGCSAYLGTSRNGVESGQWGSYQHSFYFPGKGDGQCTKIGAGGLCPRRFKDVANRGPDTELTCTCGTPSPTGSVWGSDIYTADSSICRAAQHAGVITADGGKVSVKAARGCNRYHGSTRNGVATGSWGKYEESFYFPIKGAVKCP